MNLAIFFDPLPEDPVGAAPVPTTLGAYATRFIDTFPDWRAADLALIGLDEWRGSAAGAPQGHSANRVRERFYQLQKGTGPVRLVDLGNLRPGLTLEDTYLRLREIVAALLENQTIPLLLGGSQDLDYGQFLAYETLERPVSHVTIDARVDMAEHDGARPEDTHLRRILMHEPNFLFCFSQIGHQQYLVPPGVLATLEKLHFETLRLGEVHADVRQAEPLIRQADMLSFDLSALRWPDFPGYTPPSPYGLTGEEASQLCWYAGHNDQLSSFGLYGYRPDQDEHGLAAFAAATMLWYFIEGFYHRLGETDFQSRRFMRYAIGLPGTPAKLVFYKARRTEKWWLEVESLADSSVKRIVPCSYQDYLHASQGDLPNRWILTQALLG
ncbi:formimidoylglutamase [Hymenobacter lutimineralis]|uniref:Formimidoylglutamase n=1 Tax=Hymenobacter lutimineralis TaxID=2606448 RepID=A0A5D6UXC9_9BACT|nr:MULTISPECIES: formimidoylglutamase [Hymenobacter]QIX62050.1 formimidoylglutamase [Hymenobacter sp. BT18]TYZ07014.1 formimidoylglutamase [Hymenobacter lutimineralis]